MFPFEGLVAGNLNKSESGLSHGYSETELYIGIQVTEGTRLEHVTQSF